MVFSETEPANPEDRESLRLTVLAAQKMLEDRTALERTMLQALQRAVAIEEEAKEAQAEADALQAQMNSLTAQHAQAFAAAQTEVEGIGTQLLDATACIAVAQEKLQDLIRIQVEIQSRCSSLLNGLALVQSEVGPNEEASSSDESTGHSGSGEATVEVHTPPDSEDERVTAGQMQAALARLKGLQVAKEHGAVSAEAEAEPNAGDPLGEPTALQSFDHESPAPQPNSRHDTASWRSKIRELSPGAFWVRPTPLTQEPSSGGDGTEPGGNAHQP